MVGNIPNFSRMDILRCFLRFNKNISRKNLAKELELGEGTIRTILNVLKSKKFLNSTKKGHFLSNKGNEMLKQISASVSTPNMITMQGLYPNLRKVGILVRNIPNLKGMYKLRDMAVKSGAEGALILKFNGRLYAPESGYEQDYRELKEIFEFKENDALVIAFSARKRQAEIGALVIAAELNSALKNFISEF